MPNPDFIPEFDELYSDLKLACQESTDPSKFINPFDDVHWARYLSLIEEWFGFVRFLGLPHLGRNPDVPIDRLFVEPDLANGSIPPEGFDGSTKSTPLHKAIEENKYLAILGDPGTGKSTLVNFLAWQLARQNTGASKNKTASGNQALNRVIPVPLILREILRGHERNERISFESLLDRFVDLPMFRTEDPSKTGWLQELKTNFKSALEPLLKTGQVYFLVDGIDEIGSVEVRKQLRNAIWIGMIRFPKCKWIMTSRILGYEEVPFDSCKLRARQIPAEPIDLEDNDLHHSDRLADNYQQEKLFNKLYVAPIFEPESIRVCAKVFCATRCGRPKGKNDSRRVNPTNFFESGYNRSRPSTEFVDHDRHYLSAMGRGSFSRRSRQVVSSDLASVSGIDRWRSKNTHDTMGLAGHKNLDCFRRLSVAVGTAIKGK